MTFWRVDNPTHVVVPFIEGDGTGPDIWRATRPVLEAAVQRAYSGLKQIEWLEVLAGGKAYSQTGQWLPEQTIHALRHYSLALKGPLTTPVGKGIRSLNVQLRQVLDLYVCLRPVRYFDGVPSPMRHPELVDMVVFRENTEDVYSGIEWPAESAEARELTEWIEKKTGKKLTPGSGIGIKPISRPGTHRLVRRAIEYALRRNKPSVTLVHKGNIMKFTEGAFRNWGYELAQEEFPDETITEAELQKQPGEESPLGKVIIKDRIADMMFQQVLLRPAEYSVIATGNLNGDYLSDALAAQVGGLGMAPGANMGDDCAVFEATHGSAPQYAGLDMVNPGSLILSGALLLEHLGWQEAADLIYGAIQRTISEGLVTYDLARQMADAHEVSCSQFGRSLIERMG
ncbi:MAG: isocitrate dehydrogenase (NADP(+)) [Deltaproteobacteria bacterium RBG_13_43_22]|nr:MAG: isocitrate dehydrogenase (NADP(+)) [Deltaproteobacteria bacterium RBG_13_43_22]